MERKHMPCVLFWQICFLNYVRIQALPFISYVNWSKWVHFLLLVNLTVNGVSRTCYIGLLQSLTETMARAMSSVPAHNKCSIRFCFFIWEWGNEIRLCCKLHFQERIQSVSFLKTAARFSNKSEIKAFGVFGVRLFSWLTNKAKITFLIFQEFGIRETLQYTMPLKISLTLWSYYQNPK